MKRLIAVSLLTACLPGIWAQEAPTPLPRQFEYAVILEDAPVAARVLPADRNSLVALSVREQVRSAQARFKSRIAAIKLPITATTDTLVNAVFVKATQEQALELEKISGVVSVSLTTPLRRRMDRAIDITNVRQAWNAVGGQGQAGAGVRIAVIDSGIDQAHPALTDSAMRAPAGFPKGDAAYTTGKVIVARSYISQLTTSDARYSSPDDFSPRDRVGHGTALAAIAAGVPVKAPLADISGVAPKAWLGNYKIFGTPGIHDYASTAIFVQALEDAYTDGMDVAIVASGTIPLTAPFNGPLDTASQCAATQQLRTYIPANACDVNAYAVEHAVQSGMLVVVAAGNDGCSGLTCPTLGTISSPGTAAAALTVGSTTNGHFMYSKVVVNGQTYNGIAGNGPKFTGPLTAPLVDAATLPGGATLCTAQTAGSLAGKIALVARGTCAFYEKVIAAQAGGAVAVLMYDTSSDSIVQPTYLLTETGIPIEYIGVTAGQAIKAAVTGNAGLQATIDPTLLSVDVGADVIAFDSSRGPSTGLTGLKPEIAAVGSGVYTATQTYDPNGDVWHPSGYAAVDGTSYAAAMAAGAAALVKQAHPSFSPAQIKSALVNTSSAGVVSDPDVGGLARVSAVGAGRLNAGLAVATNLTASPSVLSFGLIGTTLPAAIPVTLTNSGNTSLTLTLAVAPRDNDARATLSLSPSSVTIPAGATQTFNATLTGSVPLAGAYEGQLNITGGGASIHLPYSYIVSDKIAANGLPIFGDNYFATVSEYPVFIAFRVIDRFGTPIVGAPVAWQPLSVIDTNAADRATDNFGIAAAYVREPRNSTLQEVIGYISQTIGWPFYHYVNFQPFISKGIFNAATQLSGALAPGSYATVSGTDFASVPIIPTTGYLPISLAQVSVTFDAPGISVAAPISYASPTLINVQIPWEMQGQNSATVKVRYRDIAGPTVTLPIATTSPAYFEFTDTTNSQLTAIAQDLNYVLITSQHPAVKGQPITLYANGLGPVDNTPATGQKSSSTRLARTTSTPEVTIGGKSAQILFSGLTPETIGLYQINVVVPADAPSGLQSITLSIGGVTAKTSQIVVQ